ncbi:hypothetical protein D3C76_135550 [compost metagenome]
MHPLCGNPAFLYKINANVHLLMVNYFILAVKASKACTFACFCSNKTVGLLIPALLQFYHIKNNGEGQLP